MNREVRFKNKAFNKIKRNIYEMKKGPIYKETKKHKPICTHTHKNGNQTYKRKIYRKYKEK